MKKFFIAIMAFATLFSVSCNKEEGNNSNNSNNGNNGNNGNATSVEGRWEAPRYADTPDDIAFVAIFAGGNLDLYVIAWGQHMVGTYTLADGTVNYDISAAYHAYTDVTYDADSNMVSWSWNAGNLNASTLTLTEGYDWYAMNEEDLNRAKEDFGTFEFNVNGTTATSSLVGIPDLVFHKVQ